MAYKFSLGAQTLSGSVTFKDGLSANDSDISNVGDINVDSVSVDAAGTGLNIDGSGANTTKFKITLGDNLADALNINEGDNSYIKFTTTNGSEQIVFGKNSTFASTTIANLGTVSAATSITATDLVGTNIDGIIGADTARAGTFTAVVGTTGTYSGILKTDDTTEATSTTDGSLQTDGGLSVAKSVVIGDDLDLLSDGAILNIGSTSKFTLTDQAANNCVMAASGARLAFGNAGEYISGDGTDLDIISSGDLDITATLVDITGALTVSGLTTATGRLIVDDTTEATSTTDGSLQTDGGLSVAKDAVIGDDLHLLSDSAVLNFGADKDVSLTHVGDVGLELKSACNGGAGPLSMFKIHYDSASPANNDLWGMTFRGDDDGGNATDYAAIFASSKDVADTTEDGALDFRVMVNGTGTTLLDISKTTTNTVTVADGAVFFDIASHNASDAGLKLEGTLVTATAAEINKLDGVNATTAELNYLDITTLGSSEASKAVSADASGDITIVGAAANMVWDKSADALEFADDASAEFGTGLDMKLYHDGSNSYITNAVGALKLATETSGIAVTIGHSTSEVTVADNLTVAGNLTVQGSTVTVDSTTINVSSSFTFEGPADAHETTLHAGGDGTGDAPAADTTLYLPALSAGSYYIPALADKATAASAAVTAAEFALLDGGTARGSTALASGDGFLHNDNGTMRMTSVDKIADFFAGSGLAASSGVMSVDIDELSALGGTGLHQTQDHFMFSDNGTEKKITFSNLQDAVFADVSGDATIAAGGALTIAAGAVETAMIADNAVTLAKMAGITRGSFIVGDASGDPSALSLGSAGQFLVSDNDDAVWRSLSGDATLSATGALTIANDAVEQAMIADDAVGADQLASNAVVNASIVDGTIKADKLDIDGSTDIGAALTVNDLLIVDDAAGGTNRKCTFARVKTLCQQLDIQNIDDSGTIVVGMNYFSALGGAESCTLPASPVVGDLVYVKAPSNCSSTNTITINRAGSHTIDGATSIVLESPYAAASLCYVAANVWSIF